MANETFEEQVREVRKTTDELLPQHDLTKPGPHPMSLGDAMQKIEAEYRDALDLLGRI